jgi:hypothetical protein
MDKRNEILSKASDYSFNISVVFLASVALKDLLNGIEFSSIIGIILAVFFCVLGFIFIAIK